ncbi:MAG: RNA polymerase sigma factor [Terriglobia bacterium]
MTKMGGSRPGRDERNAAMRELTYSELPQAEDTLQTEAALQMDEGSFRAFYNLTARALWAYLAKVTGDAAAADDLMQECYYRFLRTGHAAMSKEQAKPYLFRIATNLLRDRWRRGQGRVNVPLDEMEEVPSGERTAEGVQTRSDLKGALRQLTPRELQLLWLAYVEGSSHKEISDVVGLRTASVRPMLFRARQKLLGILRRAGITGGGRK